MRSGLFVVLVVTVVSCVQSGVTVCGERVCPSGTVCDSVHGLCVTQEQLDVCETVEDGMACSLSPVSEGECNGGVCIEQVCGDGLVTGAEDCEGETETGKDCTYLDYYDPVPLKCTKRCVFDEAACTGSCGDGMVNGPAGREVCDGAPPDATSCLDYGFEGGRLDCGSLCAPAFDDCFDVGFVPFVSTVGEHVISIAQPEAGHVFLGQDQSLIHIANGVSTRTPSTYITGIWGSSASDVFAVGNAGTAYHYDGSQWTSINTGVSTDLYSVWGSGPNDVYVAGASLTMRHFNGTQWSAVPGPTDNFAFRGIHGIDANNVVAVAGDGWMRQLRDGVWSTVDTSACNDVSGKPYFDAVWMFDADHIVAVGSVGLICVRDGGVWRRIKSGTTHSLRGVSGRAWNDIFVVGDLGTVLHYDGENWWPLDAETGIDLQDVNADRDVLRGRLVGFSRNFAVSPDTNRHPPPS